MPGEARKRFRGRQDAPSFEEIGEKGKKTVKMG